MEYSYPELSDKYPNLKEHHKRILEALALRAILAPEKTMEQVCNEHGITLDAIRDLKKRNPEAIAYQNAVGELILEDTKVEADEILLKLMRSENEKTQQKALELFYKVTGQIGSYTPQINIQNNAPATQDSRVILNEIEELERQLKSTKEVVTVDFEEID
ncbi:phBC6A51 family helix-turn-helix protein [Peribacillus simplex]|uniref:phBC6A51 family helix-turn-helix protein n=1 Tax=Peribacillus simplex TaxID=1478 RepID=UPI0011A46BE9|nr:phBC6A51 family helix-turn-helix protein [Peribacillus simplex]